MQIIEGKFEKTSILNVFAVVLKYLNFLLIASPRWAFKIPLSLTAIYDRSRFSNILVLFITASDSLSSISTSFITTAFWNNMSSRFGSFYQNIMQKSYISLNPKLVIVKFVDKGYKSFNLYFWLFSRFDHILISYW